MFRSREGLQFVQCTDRRSHCLPNRQQHTNLRKRLLPTRKRFRIFPRPTFTVTTGIDFNSDLHFFVIEDEFSLEPTLSNQVAEHSDSFMTDNLAESVITVFAFSMRFPEDLRKLDAGVEERDGVHL